MTDSTLRVFEIEARTRYRVLAHNPHAALEQLHQLDDATPFDAGGLDDPHVEFIASCSVPESEVLDVTDEYHGGAVGFGDAYVKAHTESCAECGVHEAAS